jgi:hypothetical protein
MIIITKYVFFKIKNYKLNKNKFFKFFFASMKIKVKVKVKRDET